MGKCATMRGEKKNRTIRVWNTYSCFEKGYPTKVYATKPISFMGDDSSPLFDQTSRFNAIGKMLVALKYLYLWVVLSSG